MAGIPKGMSDSLHCLGTSSQTQNVGNVSACVPVGWRQQGGCGLKSQADRLAQCDSDPSPALLQTSSGRQ